MSAYIASLKTHHYHATMMQKYSVIEYKQGHVKDVGKDAGKEKNPIWIVNENDTEIWFMYCDTNTICKLCEDSHKLILDYEQTHCDGEKITWFGQNGYIYGSVPHKPMMYMHQLLMNCYGNGKGTSNVSVDHIDRDPANNMMSNLRIATRKEQEQNSKGIAPGTKRERQSIARDLPEGITQEMMPKYITYNVNVYNKEQNKSREFFRVEGHPAQLKVWESSKSNKVAIQDKLEQAKLVLTDFNNGILPQIKVLTLPKYTYFTNTRGKFHLKYDDGKRTKSMAINDPDFAIDDNAEKQAQLYLFNALIIAAHGEEYAILKDEEAQNIKNTYVPKAEHNLIAKAESIFAMPAYVSAYIERDKPLLAFRKTENTVTLNKKIGLPMIFAEMSDEEKQFQLQRLNAEIIKKYGNAYCIIETSEAQIVEIQKAATTLPTTKALPMNIYIKINTGKPYLIFDKKEGGVRTTRMQLLPNNYNINKELHIFHDRIADTGYSFDLAPYPYVPVVMPPNMYINNCELPYMIRQIGTTIQTAILHPGELQEQLDNFDQNCKDDVILEQYTHCFPENVCFCMKANKPLLLYQRRSNEIKHYISATLPDAYSINAQLIALNVRIVAKYGAEYAII